MSDAVWIFLGAYVGLIVCVVVFAVVWKYRYFFLNNRLRAEFITDRGTVTRIIKVDKASDHFEAVIYGMHAMFGLDVERQRPSGRERMPKQWHYVGDVAVPSKNAARMVDVERDGTRTSIPLFEPLDMRTVTVTNATHAVEYRNAARNKVISDLLTAFRKPKIDSTTALFLTLGAMLVGFAAVGIFMNMKFDELIEVINAPLQPIRTSSNG